MRLLRVTGRPIDVEDRWDALRNVLEETPDLVAAYVFGSYDTEYQTPLSDIDMGFVFRLRQEPDFDEEMRFRTDVLDAGGRRLHRDPQQSSLHAADEGARDGAANLLRR